MERRWSPRAPLQAQVLLEDSDTGVLSCEAQDISMEGMYVQTHQSVLKQDQHVKAQFTLEIGGESQTYVLGASVVHIKPNGVGLMFNDPDIVLCRQLNEVLFDSPSAPAPNPA